MTPSRLERGIMLLISIHPVYAFGVSMSGPVFNTITWQPYNYTVDIFNVVR